MTAKLSDLRVQFKSCDSELCSCGDIPRPVSIPELLALLEAEGVLRQEERVASYGVLVRRYVSNWQPREESSDG